MNLSCFVIISYKVSLKSNEHIDFLKINKNSIINYTISFLATSIYVAIFKI